jgi:hypothetical protein
MPRYFFQIDGEIDEEGVVLPDLRSVQVEAIRTTAEILKETSAAFGKEDLVIVVTDEAGRRVVTTAFRIVYEVPQTE